MLNFVLIQMAGFARTRVHFRVRVLAQDPAVRQRLFKNRERVAPTRVHTVPQDPSIALQPHVVDSRTLSAIPPRGPKLPIALDFGAVLEHDMAVTAVEPVPRIGSQQSPALP